MKPAPFDYHRALSVAHAVDLLVQWAPQGGRILAGGQSLVPIMTFRMAQPSHLIDINAIDGMAEPAPDGEALRIPALVRHTAFRRPVVDNPLGRVLASICPYIAHAPIRNRGTFCGSLAHADPSSEWCLAFAVLGGTARVRSARRGRDIDAATFFAGIMTTALDEDEMLTEVRLPLCHPDTRHGFDECSRRPGDYAMAMALVSYRLQRGEMVDVRAGVGGVEPNPRRLTDAEAILTGAPPTDAVFAAAADAAAAAIDPLTDGQITAAFRRDLARATMRRALCRSRD